jgi:allantoinase
MTLDPSYFEYPQRHRGMDHDLYPWSNLFTRPPIVWPQNKRLAVAVVISCEFFPLTPSDTPFRAPGHMQTAFPDYRHFTARDYGSRLGVPRLLDSLASAGTPASFALNSRWASRYPDLTARIIADGHEIIAHSTDMNGTIATGLPEAEERALIQTSLDDLEAATGTRPQGWLSIARSQSFNTPRLLAEAGVRYTLDWVNDDLPYLMTTAAGPLTNLPLNHELSDRQVIGTCQQSAGSYTQQLQDAADLLLKESHSHGGRLLAVHLTPYITGLPYRIDAVDALLASLASNPDIWFATTTEIIEASNL